MADGLPAHFNQLVTLKAENTLVVRLTGKPGSRLRVAVWLFKPATLDAVTLTPDAVRLDGSSVVFNSTIINHTNAPISDVWLELGVLQNAARKSWGRSRVTCGPNLGVLPLTPCITEGSFHEPSSEVGDGVLVPGDALAVIRLVRGATEVLDSLVVPIVLPTPAPAVLRVSIDPPRIMLLPRAEAQVTANVQTVGGASKTVTWSVIGSQVVTVSPTGFVSAVGMGYSSSRTFIRATSTVDPTKWSEIPVTVYDWRVSAPSTSVEIATGASASHPTSVNLRADVCGDIGMIPENPFYRVEFSAMSNGSPVSIGSGAVTHSEWIGPGGMHWTCWYWDLTWTPGNTFGLGRQTVYATAFGFPGATLATLVNTNITTVVP